LNGEDHRIHLREHTCTIPPCESLGPYLSSP
jgi:hypothetical protein